MPPLAPPGDLAVRQTVLGTHGDEWLHDELVVDRWRAEAEEIALDLSYFSLNQEILFSSAIPAMLPQMTRAPHVLPREWSVTVSCTGSDVNAWTLEPTAHRPATWRSMSYQAEFRAATGSSRKGSYKPDALVSARVCYRTRLEVREGHIISLVGEDAILKPVDRNHPQHGFTYSSSGLSSAAQADLPIRSEYNARCESWRWKMARVLGYAETAYEYCGCQMAIIRIHDRFARIWCYAPHTYLVESVNNIGAGLSVEELLDDIDNAEHLPHNWQENADVMLRTYAWAVNIVENTRVQLPLVPLQHGAPAIGPSHFPLDVSLPSDRTALIRIDQDSKSSRLERLAAREEDSYRPSDDDDTDDDVVSPDRRGRRQRRRVNHTPNTAAPDPPTAVVPTAHGQAGAGGLTEEHSPPLDDAAPMLTCSRRSEQSNGFLPKQQIIESWLSAPDDRYPAALESRSLADGDSAPIPSTAHRARNLTAPSSIKSLDHQPSMPILPAGRRLRHSDPPVAKDQSLDRVQSREPLDSPLLPPDTSAHSGSDGAPSPRARSRGCSPPSILSRPQGHPSDTVDSHSAPPFKLAIPLGSPAPSDSASQLGAVLDTSDTPSSPLPDRWNLLGSKAGDAEFLMPWETRSSSVSDSNSHDSAQPAEARIAREIATALGVLKQRGVRIRFVTPAEIDRAMQRSS